MWKTLRVEGRQLRQGRDFASYPVATWYAARWYAARWLDRVAAGRPALGAPAAAYGEVHDHLRVVWEALRTRQRPSADVAAALAQELRAAQAAEWRGVAAIEGWLGEG